MLFDINDLIFSKKVVSTIYFKSSFNGVKLKNNDNNATLLYKMLNFKDEKTAKKLL